MTNYAQLEPVALALSANLQRRVWNAIEDPSLGCAQMPHITVCAVAEVFCHLLVTLTASTADDRAFALYILDQAQAAVLARTDPAVVDRSKKGD